MADGPGLGGGAAASKRATCLPRRGPSNVGTEGPTHDATVQDAPPQNPVLPVASGPLIEWGDILAYNFGVSRSFALSLTSV